MKTKHLNYETLIAIIIAACFVVVTVISYSSISTKKVLASQNTTNNKIEVDVSKKGIEISPLLYGVFFEDINSGADGGLYAELIQNRSFEFPNELTAWDFNIENNSNVKALVITSSPISEKNPHYLNIDIMNEVKKYKIINYGYNGISVKGKDELVYSIYLRSPNKTISKIQISLEDEEGNTYAISEIGGITDKWKIFEGKLTCTKGITSGLFVITINGKGKLDIDMVSLFPKKTWKNRPNGLRYDLAKLIADLKPSFFRFPGGCIVEGRTMTNAYRWKDTIGDISERPTNENLWGYYQSYGLGFYEYFLFCEDIGAEPLPVINCGMACQARGGDMVNILDLDEYIQDALDLIEFANGSEKTKWGAVRTKLGHPKPFNLKFLAVGNEQWSAEYYLRYQKFYDAIKKRYPDIKVIFAAGPSASGKIFDDAWEWIKNTKKGDIVDEHYYMPPEWFLTNTKRYETYDRKGPKVFVGEYAAHTLGRKNNLESALSEAAYLLGLEKNSDVVIMASYAPLFAKEYATQWEPTLIKFNNEESYATPNYYVQKVFNQNKGKFILPTTLAIEKKITEKSSIKGKIGLGSWLTHVEYKDLKVTNIKGSTIYSDNFKDSYDKWEIPRGMWIQENNTFIQSSLNENCYAISGNENWSDYTLTVKAKKVYGNEGFLILFGTKDSSNYYWWNIGGWGNTASAIEKSINGTKYIIGKFQNIKINDNKWYDIKIQLSGNRIRCYLDGKLIHDVVDEQNFQQVFACSSLDNNGDVLIKVVNISNEKQKFNINLKGIDNKSISQEGTVTIITSDSLEDENTFYEPQKIYPKTINIKGISNNFAYEFDKYSVTVIRVKKK